MTAPTTRRVGRPRKQPENPDCEVATKGYVKRVARQYHEQQTVKNMKHRQGSEGSIMAFMWALVTIGCLAWWFSTKDITAQISCVVTGLLFANAMFVAVGWVDTIRESYKHTDFMQKYEPPCEPKRGCDEQEG